MSNSSKLGEATFSEVFKFEMINSVREVIKIIPLELETSAEVDIYPLPININAAIHECKVLNEVSALSEFRKDSFPSNWTGFNENLEICVVKGQYPERLINDWQNWQTEKGTENSNPGNFESFKLFFIFIAYFSIDRYNGNQHFLVISMMDGGVDLEKFKLKNMRQVQSIVKQLVSSLALAEEKIQFEHRDLHLGNILIKETDWEKFMSNEEEFEFDGIQCSIIDYSLSRMKDGKNVTFRDLDTIEWLFEGDPKIDLQYQVYKDMRTSKDKLSWKDFNPRSNILWLAFILDKLVLRQKKTICNPKNIFNSLSELQRRIYSYSSVKELKLNDEFFKK